MTTPEIPTLAAMLEDLAIRLQAEAYREEAAFEALPETTAPKALTERAQQARSIAAKYDYAQAVTSTWLELEAERQEALRERFAGELVPSDPLALLAMWTTLLTDMDELGGDYAGEPLEALPVFEAWSQVDSALHSLAPDTIPAATAIAFAAKRDIDEAGGLGDWDEERVEAALALALPRLERPR